MKRLPQTANVSPGVYRICHGTIMDYYYIVIHGTIFQDKFSSVSFEAKQINKT